MENVIFGISISVGLLVAVGVWIYDLTTPEVKVVGHRIAEKRVNRFEKNLIVKVEFVPGKISRIWKSSTVGEYIGSSSFWYTYPGIETCRNFDVSSLLSDYYRRVKHEGNWDPNASYI